MLLQDLPSLLHVVAGPSVQERLPDCEAEQVQLAVDLIELVEKLLREVPLLVEGVVQDHARQGLDEDFSGIWFPNWLVGDLLGGELESIV